MIHNHPECKRWLLGVSGPVESKVKIIITKEPKGWAWRYKRPFESKYVCLGLVKHIPVSNLYRSVRIDIVISEVV